LAVFEIIFENSNVPLPELMAMSFR